VTVGHAAAAPEPELVSGPVRVLVVCTANVCRSPAAELLLRAGLALRLGAAAAEQIAVSSAGTWAGDARPVEPGTAAALRRHGVSAAEVAAARSTPLTAEAVVGADLVIGATADHVRDVWRLDLSAQTRSFTLGELARLTEGLGEDLPDALPGERLRALVAAAGARREERRLPGRPYVDDAYDVADPTDNDPAQRTMVEETASLVDLLLDVVVGPPPTRVSATRRAVQWALSRARGAPR